MLKYKINFTQWTWFLDVDEENELHDGYDAEIKKYIKWLFLFYKTY